MKRELTCIICPRGCALTAEVDAQQVCVGENSCQKGEEYAINECLHSVRTVTTTLRVANRRDIMVSVKTENPEPKAQMDEVVAQLRKTVVNAPVAIGDVVQENISGSRIIITKAVQ